MSTPVPTNEGATPCTTADPELFQPFESQTDLVGAAKSLCHRCPIKRQCLRFALDNPGEVGIWGGTTESERVEMRAGRAPARVTVPAVSRKAA